MNVDLKRKVNGLVGDLRKNEYAYGRLDRVASVAVDDIMVDGQALRRRRIVLNTHGCSVATCTMCPLPDESVPDNVTVTDQNLIDQFTSAMEGATEDVITVWNNGNFFSDREISPFVRDHIYAAVRKSGASRLVVESLPAFITEKKLDEAKRSLGSVKLTVAIGLQSWNDDIREIAINSTCTKPAFLKAHGLLSAVGYNSQVFLMFKPPFLSTDESFAEVIDSIGVLNGIGVRDIVVSPLRVAKNTLVSDLHARGLYNPPSLWSLKELILRVSWQCDDTNVRFAMSILTGEDGIDSIRVPVTEKFLAGVKEYNLYGFTDGIWSVPCLPEPHDLIPNDPRSIKERVKSIL